MNHPTLATNKTCTGCIACVDVCPTSALSSTYDRDGHLTYNCDTDKCILCHQCEKTCPVISNYQYKTSGYFKSYAAWANDHELRMKSSSGGVFAAMASYIINHGGYVVGASNEGVCDIRHIAISTNADLSKLQSSKYTQSNATTSYQTTFRLLKDGATVLFSGTGCQVAGLLSFLRKKVYSGRLITVDLICGGVPSRLLIDKFLQNEPFDIRRILSFRTKDHGWKSVGFAYNMKVEDYSGRIHDYTGVKNLVTDGFCSEMTNRYSCYNCQFNGLSRKSDFTIGDLWGDKKYPKQHKDGLSLVVTHSEEADGFLKDIRDYLHSEPTDIAEALKHNYRLNNGFHIGGRMFERKHISWMFSHLSYANLKHVYANDIHIFSPWFLYKVIRKIRIILLNRIFHSTNR